MDYAPSPFWRKHDNRGPRRTYVSEDVTRPLATGVARKVEHFANPKVGQLGDVSAWGSRRRTANKERRKLGCASASAWLANDDTHRLSGTHAASGRLLAYGAVAAEPIMRR